LPLLPQFCLPEIYTEAIVLPAPEIISEPAANHLTAFRERSFFYSERFHLFQIENDHKMVRSNLQSSPGNKASHHRDAGYRTIHSTATARSLMSPNSQPPHSNFSVGFPFIFFFSPFTVFPKDGDTCEGHQKPITPVHSSSRLSATSNARCPAVATEEFLHETPECFNRLRQHICKARSKTYKLQQILLFGANSAYCAPPALP